jgi:amino acid adenylation domain-containing protein
MSLDLPFDYYRAPGRARRRRVERFASSGSEQELVAALAIVLARYSGQEQLTLVERRGRERVRSLRLNIGPATTGREALAQARQALGDFAADGRGLGRLEADPSLVLVTRRTRAALVYDASLFKPSSVRRLARHLRAVLASLGTTPDTAVAALPLLSAEERRQIEATCDGAGREHPAELIHAAIARRAALAPEATALRFRDEELSYGALDRRANQLAHYLLQSGIAPGARVVVCVEPGFEVVIALLGILKAGAAYVPLDPTYPPARLAAIFEDTEPALVITQEHLQARLPDGPAPRLTLDALDDLPGTDPGLAIEPERVAYVFYTSGTTGAPKGILASHANLRHYVRSAEQRYEFGSQDVMPALARFGFSISLFELLTPLVAGGTLLVLEREHVMDPARLARSLSEVTIFHAGPSLLKGLVAYVRQHYRHFSEFSRVRHASSGGDMVPPELLEALKEIFSRADVFVIYGSSELSCMGCTYPVPRDRRIDRTYVGRPFDNVSVRVLDPAGNLLPPGLAGEVHFAGDGIVSGYLNRPELMAQKFVHWQGRRYYRTGDTGRLSEDGWLEILGRSDFQVKLRGMRVELAEVDAQLRRAPGVRDAAATTKPTSDGEKMLVAYYVPETAAADGKATRIAAIRQHLATHLPDYMVPAVYVELERLPVNHNLKLDRRALPEPTEADFRAGSEQPVREPRTPAERGLAEIWRRLLGLEQVGLDDNFFELGGHSLLALKLGLETEKALGMRLEGIDVLREPLVVLAARCEGRSPSTAPSSLDARAAETPEIFHFGEGGSLYGVLYGRPQSAVEKAVLVCSPLGQEHVRARFVLTRLAKRLARSGMPTLLFDYYGTGDSLGETAYAGFRRWRSDVAQAHAELERRTGASSVVGIGVRLGALLLCQVAPHLDFSRLVLWDPIEQGREHLADLSRSQRQYLRSLAPLGFFRTLRRPHKNELLGNVYSAAALRELETLRLASLLPLQRCPVDRADFDCAWRDLSRLEDIIADTAISSTLAELAGNPS